jgi:hypothetical protein
MKANVNPEPKRGMDRRSAGNRHVTVWSMLLLTLMMHLTLSSVMVSAARAVGGSLTVLNGSDPRPFYIMAHNPNTLEEVDAALQVGGVDADALANALEPDITLATGCAGGDILVDWDSTSPNRGGHCDDTHFVDWLMYVHDRAIEHPELALILFDIKPSAASVEHVEEIVNDIHSYLNYGPVNLNVLLSVASIGDASAFDKAKILDHLGPREGVNIDQENDVDDVLNFFFQQGYAANINYGDGTAIQGLFLPRAIDKAAFRRASIGYPRLISDVFTLNHDTSMNSFIYAGADSIIPDAFGVIESGDPAYLHQLANVVSQHPEVRRATRDDNPFEPALQSYGLEIRTAGATPGEPFPGTDANLTFKLKGCRGEATITVDTGNINDVPYDSRRMRDANLIDTPSPAGTDWVTIPSTDLGRLTSISIFNDGTGDAPDWRLVDVRVSSAGWLGPDYGGLREYTVTYNDWVKANTTVPLNLTPNFTEPPPTIQCPAPITVVNAPGLCGAPVMFSPTVDGMCPDVTAHSSKASGSFFAVGTTQVTSYAQSASDPQHPSDPCTFTVTVHDNESPAIICPAPIVVNATGPAGAVVSYAPTVSDNCSVTSTTCAPASSSTFAVGVSTAACTAADAASNQSSCSFNVHVKGAAEQTSDLIAAVNNLATKAGTKNALIAKLTTALGKLQSNDTAAACGPLQSFINEVNAQRGKDITVSDADALIAAATQIRAVDGCAP